MCDTIVATATANGIGSISIVRVSGKDALRIALQLTHKNELTPRYANLCYLYDKEELIDQAIVIYFQNPFSFTGEDVVEFQCHGGYIVANELIETILKLGARVAEPGEFSKRAFLNGKIDLSQAEAIAKLIEAKSVDAAKILSRQLKGTLSNFVNECKDKLLLSLAHSEVMIDYAEEDLPKDATKSIEHIIEKLEEKFGNLLESSLRRQGLIDGFNVAIIGKPNVGKSSLLNRLLNYDRAIVSEIAGTTRDTIEENLRIGTHIVRLIDTAGIREANDEIEKIGVERSRLSIEDADVVVALFDSSRIWDKEDDAIASIVENLTQEQKLIVVLNKTDLEQKLYNPFLNSLEIIPMSIKNNSLLFEKKLESVLDSISRGEDEIMLISTRQIHALKMALSSLKDAKMPLQNEELELFSYHIMDALRYISAITKPYDNEEILDKMFSEFCLGK